jgi:HTH-type transcriptional regulator/antitoxin HipB
MKTKNDNLTSFADFLDEQYGPIGTPSRDEYEKGFQEFLVGVMIKEARLAQGMTQIQLAEKCETTKAYISKVENSVKDVRISTLRKIVENGLGGHLQVSIQF